MRRENACRDELKSTLKELVYSRCRCNNGSGVVAAIRMATQLYSKLQLPYRRQTSARSLS